MTDAKETKRIIFNKDILIPFSLLASVVGAATWVAYFGGMYNQRMITVEDQIRVVQAEIRTLPSRGEFDALQTNLRDIKDSIDKLGNKLDNHMAKKD